eukprot:g14442.t1
MTTPVKETEASSISPSLSYLKTPPESLSPISPLKTSKLVQFATVGIAHKVEEILDDKVNYSPTLDEMGWALMACVRFGREECTKLLILRGAPVVAKRGNLECVELLLDRNAALEKADKYGKTPLIYSCMKDNNDDVVRALLKRGALPNSKDNSGSTPLMYCAQYTDSDKMCSLLVKHGSLIDNYDDTNNNACMYASKHGNKKILSKMRERESEILEYKMKIKLLEDAETNYKKEIQILRSERFENVVMTSDMS